MKLKFLSETNYELTKLLIDRGYTVTGEYSHEAELIICIGGDGFFFRDRPLL